MDFCDVLIVGGGPAGSACAWKLKRSGLDATILEKKKFPRDKVCGGWITPQVIEELEIDTDEYAKGRIFQPITGFRTSQMGAPDVETKYDNPVSYGVRRFEFDHYLVQRSGARLLDGEPLETLERSDDRWIANNHINAKVIIGAGGHFCPVARILGAKLGDELIVAAQEAEFEMDSRQRAECSIQSEVPELYYCADLKGYGWCFRKQNYLNIGLGRLDKHHLSRHVAAFVEFLKKAGKVPADVPASLPGHAYLLYGRAKRAVVGSGVLLIGDAAGLAYWQSGEGIRTAIESGLLAAKTLLDAGSNFDRVRLEKYRTLLSVHFGKAEQDRINKLAKLIPPIMIGYAARKLLAKRWFSRHVLLNRWFLHSHQPALSLS